MSVLNHTDHGFDYAATVTELLQKFTYREIADRLGYSSVGSITSILDGKVPSHHHGEALWVLYQRIYGKRPPLTIAQRIANSLTQDL